MADFNIEEERTSTERGQVVTRVYDQLSVDFLVQHMTRVAVRAKVAGRAPTFQPLPLRIRRTLVRRVLPAESS